MKRIFSQLLYEIEHKQDCVLVTVVAEQGSTPRGSGAQMLVGAAGRITGTIGGGAVEFRADEMARTLLAKKGALLHRFRLNAKDTDDLGMVCGGDMTVLFHTVPHDDAAWEGLARTALSWMEARKHGGLFFDLSQPEQLPQLTEAEPAACAETLILPLPSGTRIFIFGGGHIAQELVPLLPRLDFRAVVFENRAEYAQAALFPAAEQVILGDYKEIHAQVTISAEDFVVIMTNGHSHDLTVQEQVMRGSYAYLGVIGSRTKIRSINRTLIERGITEEKLQTVHTPIGTAIKAVTPAEIAISIAGELILVRAEQRPEPNRAGCPMHRA